MRAAVEVATDFDSVPDDTTTAVLADGRNRLDSALKTVKRMVRTRRNQFKRLVVLVSANFTLCHWNLHNVAANPSRIGTQ